MSNTTRKSQAKKLTLIVLIMFVLIAVIGGTYSRYINTATGNAQIDLAKWSVKINGTNMSAIDTLTVPLEYEESDYVTEDKLAPGTSATFTLVIDPTDSEVAIDYEIALGAVTGLTNNGSAIALTGATYTVQGGTAQNATINEGAGTIELTEALADVEADKTVTVVGTITWDNADDANNTADTANGWADPTPTASVTVTAKQHI